MAALFRSLVPLRCASRQIHTGTVAPESTTKALELIRSQPSQYVIASLKGMKYVLTPRDLLTLPHLPTLKVGDVLKFDQIVEIGSRDFTLRGSPYLPKDQVKVEATVVEHTKGKLEYIFKKKRRKGYQKTIQHKQTYTRIRVGEVVLGPVAPEAVVKPSP